MTTVADALDCLNRYAPPELAEGWDNTGLLVGDLRAEVRHLMTCLTVTPESADEAIARQADLVVTHHPLPFRPLSRITAGDPTGQLLLRLIRARIAVISAHTAFDSASNGINRMLAERLGLANPRVLVPGPAGPDEPGAGRIADAPGDWRLADLLARACNVSGPGPIRFAGDASRAVRQVALACGSGGSFLEAACRAGCDTMVTGEATFHTCLEARSRQVSLVLLGHYQSERFGIEALAEHFAGTFPDVRVWASESESDPIAMWNERS